MRKCGRWARAGVCSRKNFRPRKLWRNRRGTREVLGGMKAKSSLLAATAASVVLFAGCAGTGPNTQRGAVGGAALGAIAGAIIGNNSGSGNAASGALIGAAAGGLAGGAMGNATDHERGTIYRSEAEATTTIVVNEPPPPPPHREDRRYERPYSEAVWIDGYWAYSGNGRYTWVEGRWERPPERYRTYVAPHWQRHRGGYVYVEGYWRG